MDASVGNTALAPPLRDVALCWTPIEGEPVAVLDYPSPHPLGVIEWIERDVGGAATTYWIWMLDGCRIALQGAGAPLNLTRV